MLFAARAPARAETVSDELSESVIGREMTITPSARLQTDPRSGPQRLPARPDRPGWKLRTTRLAGYGTRGLLTV